MGLEGVQRTTNPPYCGQLENLISVYDLQQHPNGCSTSCAAEVWFELCIITQHFPVQFSLQYHQVTQSLLPCTNTPSKRTHSLSELCMGTQTGPWVQQGPRPMWLPLRGKQLCEQAETGHCVYAPGRKHITSTRALITQLTVLHGNTMKYLWA